MAPSRSQCQRSERRRWASAASRADTLRARRARAEHCDADHPGASSARDSSLSAVATWASGVTWSCDSRPSPKAELSAGSDSSALAVRAQSAPVRWLTPRR